MLKRFFALIAIITTSVLASTAVSGSSKPQNLPIESPEAIADSLKKELAAADNAPDSLRLLAMLYDVASRTDRAQIGTAALELAVRDGDSAIGLDMVRNLANMNFSSDSQLMRYREIAEGFPQSEDREETLLFVDLLRNFCAARYSTKEERMCRLDRLVAELKEDDSLDTFERIRLLHAICMNIKDISSNPMLPKYIDALEEEVNKLRPEAYPIRNVFCVHASMAYRDNPFTRGKGAEYDKRLLSEIDSLEKGKYGLSRRYRNYDPNRYILYTRILSNYDSLSLSEVKAFYKKAMALVARDSTAAHTNRISLRPQIYMAMKEKRYGDALPMLKKMVNNDYNSQVRPLLLRLMLKSARAVGDKDAVAYASGEYIRALESELQEGTLNKWRELEIIYDLNKTKDEYVAHQLKMHNAIFIGAIAAMVLLALLLAIVVYLLAKSKRLARNLKMVNRKLMQERDNLQAARNTVAQARDQAELANKTKTAFIHNLVSEVRIPLETINEYAKLILENVDFKKKPYLRRYRDLVLLNSEMASMLVNDLCLMAELDSGKLVIEPRRGSLRKVCAMAVASVKMLVNPGVEVVLADGDDVIITTDSRRLLHILWQLLSNAAKFTHAGTIKLSYHVDENRKNVCIDVEDTGYGISPENSERIFERFVKLDPSMPGAGIGLPLARELAELLGGTLKFIPTLTPGAKFEITIPIRLL